MSSRDERRSGAGIRASVGRFPVLAFVVVLFAWSWGYWTLVSAVVGRESISYLVTWPGLWGPPIAAVAVVRVTGGSVRSFLRRVLRFEREYRRYAVAIGGATAFGVVSPLLQGLLAGTGFDFDPFAPVAVAVVAVFAGGSEEIGWRGFAHPLLRERHSALRAGLLLGVVAVAWHGPLRRLGIGFDGPFSLFFASTVAVSVLLGWLYDGTRGSVLPVVIGHAAIDAPSVLSPAGPVSAELVRTSQLVTVAAYWLVVVCLVVKNGPQLSSRSRSPSPPAVGPPDSGPTASEPTPENS